MTDNRKTRGSAAMSHFEFSLRAAGGCSRVLMQRRRDDPKAIWRDIASFDSYNDAEYVLSLLNRKVPK